MQDQIDFLNDQLVKKADAADAATAKLNNLPHLESMLRRTNASKKTAEETAAALRARVQECEKTIRSQESALANLASEKAHKESMGEGAMQQLKQMKGYATTAELDAAALRSRLESVVKEREEARARVADLEARLNDQNPSSAEPRQMFDGGEVRTQALMVQTLQRERDALRKEIDTVTLRLRQERATASEALQSADTARANEASASRRIDGLKEEIKELTRQLAEKTATIRSLNETVRKSSSMASLPQVVSDMREELARMRERCTNAEMGRDKARHSETRADEANQRLSLQIERLEDALADAQEAREQARRAMVAADNNAEEANARARTAEADRDEAVRSYRKISADLQAQIEADNERLLQLDALTDDVKAARETALVARQQSERANDQATEARRRMERTEVELQQSRATETSARRESSRLVATVSGLEKRLHLAESRAQQFERALGEANDKLSNTQADLQQAMNERNDHEKTVGNLKTLMAQTKFTKESAEFRLRSAHDEVKEATLALTTAKEETAEKDQELRFANEKLRQMESAMKQLDAQKDAYQDELDAQTEVMSKLKDEKAHMYKSVDGYKAQIKTMTRQIESITKALQGRDVEVRNVRNQIAELTSRYVEQSNALELRDTELEAMSKDLANMAKENQAVNEGAGSLRQANQALSRRLEDSEERSNHAEALCRRQEKERIEINNAYRASCEERARLEANIQDLSAQRANMTLKLQEAGAELSQLRARLREGDFGTQTWRTTKSNYERQLAELAAANESLSRRLRRAEDASTTGKNEVAQAKEATAALATTQSSLRYDNAQLRALADEARNRIEQLQAANGTLRSALEVSQTKKIALEESLGSARATIAKLNGGAGEQAQLDSEKAAREAEVRIEKLNTEVSGLKRDKLMLERMVEEMKLELSEQERRAEKLREMAEKYERGLDGVQDGDAGGKS